MEHQSPRGLSEWPADKNTPHRLSYWFQQWLSNTNRSFFIDRLGCQLRSALSSNTWMRAGPGISRHVLGSAVLTINPKIPVASQGSVLLEHGL